MLAVRTNNADILEETERGKEEHRRLKYGETVKFNGMEEQILGKAGTVDLSKGVYYLEEDDLVFGVRQLLTQVRDGVFAAFRRDDGSSRNRLQPQDTCVLRIP